MSREGDLRAGATGPSLPLSSGARVARMPPPPVELLAALQDEFETAARPRVPGKAVRRPARQARTGMVAFAPDLSDIDAALRAGATGPKVSAEAVEEVRKMMG